MHFNPCDEERYALFNQIRNSFLDAYVKAYNSVIAVRRRLANSRQLQPAPCADLQDKVQDAKDAVEKTSKVIDELNEQKTQIKVELEAKSQALVTANRNLAESKAAFEKNPISTRREHK